MTNEQLNVLRQFSRRRRIEERDVVALYGRPLLDALVEMGHVRIIRIGRIGKPILKVAEITQSGWKVLDEFPDPTHHPLIEIVIPPVR